MELHYFRERPRPYDFLEDTTTWFYEVHDDKLDVPQPYERFLLLDTGPPSINPVVSFKMFDRLRVLKIEQVSLYSASHLDFMPRLVDILPPSLQFLEFEMVYRSFRGDMGRLVSEAPRNLPNLGAITISVVGPGSLKYYDQVVADVNAVPALFEGSGIKFSVTSRRIKFAEPEQQTRPY